MKTCRFAVVKRNSVFTHTGDGACGAGAVRLSWLMALMLCLAFMSNAWALDVNPEQASEQILSGVSVHVQSGAALNMAQVIQLPEAAWTPVAGAINAGYNDKVHWFRFPFHNASAQDRNNDVEGKSVSVRVD